MTEKSITDMLSSTIADPDATLVDVFGLKSKPADDYFKQLSDIVGSIQQTPFMETKEGQQTMLDMVTGSGGGIGASLKGGKQVAESTMQQLSKMGKKFGIKEHPSKWEWGKEMIDDFINNINKRNKSAASNIKYDKAREAAKVARAKHGDIRDPDFEPFIHPVNYLIDKVNKLTRN